MPLLAMEELTEPAAFAAILSVLCEPDPARGEARGKLRPGLMRDGLEHASKHWAERGKIIKAKTLAFQAVQMPSPISARLAWQKAWPDIQLASQICWFLYEARLLEEERYATITAACRAWAIAASKPGEDVSQRQRYVQMRWRSYRPVAHLCAAFCAFQAEGIKGYVNLLAVAEAILDYLDVRIGRAPQKLLDRSKAWVIPEALGPLRAELRLTADPAGFGRRTAGLCSHAGE